jgi:hypothetical protein
MNNDRSFYLIRRPVAGGRSTGRLNAYTPQIHLLLPDAGHIALSVIPHTFFKSLTANEKLQSIWKRRKNKLPRAGA